MGDTRKVGLYEEEKQRKNAKKERKEDKAEMEKGYMACGGKEQGQK